MSTTDRNADVAARMAYLRGVTDARNGARPVPPCDDSANDWAANWDRGYWAERGRIAWLLGHDDARAGLAPQQLYLQSMHRVEAENYREGWYAAGGQQPRNQFPDHNVPYRAKEA